MLPAAASLDESDVFGFLDRNAATLDGEHFDAVIVRVGKSAADQSHEFAQRYRRGGFRGKRLERVGNPGYAGSAPGLFS